MHDQNLTPAPSKFFVCGQAKHTNWVVVEYAKVDKGWRSTVVYGEAPKLNNAYVSGETEDELAEWFKCDFSSRPLVVGSLSDAMEHIPRKCARPLFS